jgi:hypothetical protein
MATDRERRLVPVRPDNGVIVSYFPKCPRDYLRISQVTMVTRITCELPTSRPYADLHKYMSYFCPISTKTGMTQQMPVKFPNTKFHKHTFSRSRVVTCGKPNGQLLVAKTPKKSIIINLYFSKRSARKKRCLNRERWNGKKTLPSNTCSL